MTEEKRWRCEACEAISIESALLTAPNPFDADQTITGCPACKAIEGFAVLCDEPGCDRPVTCGFPLIRGGYRNTCSNHARINEPD